ncbi:carboxymethylenebutenolidase [Thalassospira profundimaris]|uniref:Carboxymethylenebutenolidase n=1 Tax=Thalassospira profundimaris TaxID=502049 RepID=A0A367XDK3_9PROT|nr:dienelactone hydrolase family protein [Thalassospira profundimaris]RCK50722.1 carboxymethylenebutenolidase [Thalassospira profundimaris]
MSQNLAIKTADGTFNAYVAMPEKLPAPVVVVIQEIFGVNAVMRGVADDYARQGYIAVCPDLFWRLEPGIELTDKTDEEWQKAFGYLQKFNPDKGAEDIQATLDAARALPDASGKAAVVGYCMGGMMTYLAATRTDADAFASFYGAGIDNYLGEADKISKPLIMHLAGQDEFIPTEAQDKIKAALKDKAEVTIYQYPDSNHAFCRVGGNHYDEQAAATANARTAEFLKQNLA